MRAITNSREVVISLTALAIHSEDPSLVTDPKKYFDELDENEKSLFDNITQDIRPMSAIKRIPVLNMRQKPPQRHGIYRFMIGSDECEIEEGFNRSSLKLDKNETFCNSDRIKNVIDLACQRADVELTEFACLQDGETMCYMYTVFYS